MQRGLFLLLGIAAGAAATRFQRERQRAERLAAAALETLLNAIDANDAVTGAHVRRVAAYALVLGDAAGLGEHECRAVERVALFHDNGKIHEALFDIVHDNVQLSPEERRLIATHPTRGAEVLEPLAAFYPELPEGVKCHHERWDGTGYPRKLKGTAIPIAARIVSIADTFDVVTHRRRYKDAGSATDGRTQLLEGRGTQFDPALVDLVMLPPIFERFERAVRNVERSAARPRRRGSSDGDDSAPDVTFRWRSASTVQQSRRGSASSSTVE
jgi:HD-GYP domain-containing protein (c-di-GMP phosphodiesterase class II)